MHAPSRRQEGQPEEPERAKRQHAGAQLKSALSIQSNAGRIFLYGHFFVGVELAPRSNSRPEARHQDVTWAAFHFKIRTHRLGLPHR